MSEAIVCTFACTLIYCRLFVGGSGRILRLRACWLRFLLYAHSTPHMNSKMHNAPCRPVDSPLHESLQVLFDGITADVPLSTTIRSTETVTGLSSQKFSELSDRKRAVSGKSVSVRLDLGGH